MFKFKKKTIKILFLVFFIALLHLFPTGFSEYQETFYLAGASSIVPPISKTTACNASLKLEKQDSHYNLIIENLSKETYNEWELTFYKEKQITLANLEETANGWLLKGINLNPKEPIIIPITLEVDPEEEEEEKYLNFYFEKFVFFSSCKKKET